MNRLELLNTALELIELVPIKDAMQSQKKWIINEKIALSVTLIERYYLTLEEIFLSEKFICERFSRKKIFSYVENLLIKNKLKNSIFCKESSDNFFLELSEIKPKDVYVLAPISGIRINLSESKFSIFEFVHVSKLKMPLSNGADYYIKVFIQNIYDDQIAISKAKNAFDDFARLAIFISGRNDKNIFIKTGLPIYPNISQTLMYVETSSYQLFCDDKEFPSGEISNKYIEKIPIDNDFFIHNEQFSKLLSLYEKKHFGKKISDLEKRIVNASLSIGESMMSENIKNSIIYTCIALEILFSFDEGSIFQKSIADRLADTFVFIVAKDKQSRIDTSKIIKKVYSMRSALVHGGEKSTNDDYITINILMRAAITDLLNNEKYKIINKIDDLYNMVKDAHYSY